MKTKDVNTADDSSSPRADPSHDEEHPEGRLSPQQSVVVSLAKRTPKFVFTICSPCLVTVNQEDANQPMKDFVDKSFTSINTSKGKNKKLKIKMRSLIMKMVNNLIRQGLIAHEAINVLSSAGNVEVRILMAPHALPILMERCERIGVGSVVGHTFATPLETAMLPEIGPPKELVWSTADATNNTSTEAISLNDQTLSTAKTKLLQDDDNDNDGDSISSEEEGGEEVGKKGSTDSRLQVPLLSPERKRNLQKKVAAAREEWRKTASRIRVEQVVEEVSAGAAFTLDYLAFVICASIIAAVGLASDSSVSVIASMLVSPIMGPVLGFTFGTTIRRKSLILKSFRNEAVSLLICILVGMLMGILAARSNAHTDRDWPSTEMTSRGDVHALVTGIWVAIPSGMAVALSTLGKNSSGMTGVAISLSLLPPAVNAGLCWMYELLLLANWTDRNEGDDTNYWEIGSVSFALTILNIVCIWLGGIFMFWLKEVAPVKKKNVFWSHDVKVARKEDDELQVDTEIIKDGFEAVLELKEAETRQDTYREEGPNVNLTSFQVGAARRKALADNAMEDAFFFGTNFGLNNEIVGGGAVSDALPDESELLDAAKNRASVRKSIFDVADKFGGLEGAGEALFDSNFASESSFDKGGHAGLIPHEIVVEQILVQDVFDPKKSKSN